MKLLIFGGGGMIGQAIAKKHIAEGDEVYIHDIRVNPYVDYSNMVGIDVTGGSGDIDFDIISHQAALVGVGQSQYDIHRYTSNNLEITSSILQAILNMKKFNCKILFAGSMGPYGNGARLGRPTSETQKLNPKSIYAVTKMAQESLIKVFSETYGTPSLSLRYFSAYSTTQNPLNPYTGVLSIIANKLLNSDRVELFGKGNQYRDLIEVSDIAEAHFLASRYEWKGFDAMNVGTGIPSSLATISEMMMYKLNPFTEIVFNGKNRKGDITGIYADISKIQDKLGWTPKVKIDDGINRYCDFVNANKEKYTHPDTTAEENAKLEEIGLIK